MTRPTSSSVSKAANPSLKHYSLIKPLLLTCSLSFAMLGQAHAASFTVDTTNDTVDANIGDGTCADSFGDCSLRAAVQETNALIGLDIINLAPSTSYSLSIAGSGEDAAATGDLDITDDLTIVGDNLMTAIRPRINAEGIDRIFDIKAGATVDMSRILLTNGLTTNGNNGAGILNAGQLNLENFILTNNRATGFNSSGVGASGGALANTGAGTVSMSVSAIENNEAVRAGGGIEDDSNNANAIVLSGVNFSNNRAGPSPGNGGALHVTGSGGVVISNSLISGNTAASEGGALWNGAGRMDITGSNILRNRASGDDADQGGGGLFNAGGAVNLTDSALSINKADGAAGSGGAVLNDAGGTLTVNGGSIRNNSSVRAGGGIETTSGTTVTLIGVQVDRNTTGPAPGNGGGLHVTGNAVATVVDANFNNNIASSEGGGLWNGSGTMEITNTAISRNLAQGDAADNGGGGVFNAGGTLTINGGVISRNTAVGTLGSGGGIFNDLGGVLRVNGGKVERNVANRAGGGIEDNSGSSGGLTLDSMTLSRNLAAVNPLDGVTVVVPNPGNGGGLHITGPGNSSITNSTILRNLAASEGGGLWNGSGTMTVSNTELLRNEARGANADNGGGGIFNAGGTVNIADAKLTRNEANGTAGSGGGLMNDGGNVTITRSIFDINEAERAGGAIEDRSTNAATTLIISNSVLEQNNVGVNPGNGGALHNTGVMSTMSISSSTIANNDANNEGGGLWVFAGSTLNLSNVTVASNRAAEIDGSRSRAEQGGGIFLQNMATLNALNTTIALNRANAEGGGIFAAGPATAINMNNTLIADNVSRAGPDVAGTITGANNLIGDASGATVNRSNNIVDVSAGLAPTRLADNGGDNGDTIALTSESPAVGAGDNATCPNVDQRGVARPGVADGVCDIGAYESPFSPTPEIGSLDNRNCDEGAVVNEFGEGCNQASGGSQTPLMLLLLSLFGLLRQRLRLRNELKRA